MSKVSVDSLSRLLRASDPEPQPPRPCLLLLGLGVPQARGNEEDSEC